ncbi:MAG TPA: hypothetical protein VFA21_19545 [Pyrinomonadaceae bacterium]|nr:hypothetical protein [Pyrinomonadaceae bacterium]
MNWHAARRVMIWLLTALLVFILLLAAAEVASAQCFVSPTGESAVGLRNESSYYLLFFIDEERMDGVPSGDRSIYFVVSPGEHTLRAEAVINTETVNAYRKAVIPEGYVCTWTVTDPPPSAGAARKGFQDGLRRIQK